MNSELTEEEMRHALFGEPAECAPVVADLVQDPNQNFVIRPTRTPPAYRNPLKKFTPRLKVTLSVGNEFEGQMFELILEFDTLSTLLAEQEATKAARKKYRYVEVISVKSVQQL